MKKIIFSLAAFVAATASTFAVADEATSTFVYNPATSLVQCYSFPTTEVPTGTRVSLGVEIPEGYRQLYAGQHLSSVGIVSPVNGSMENNITEATLCLTHSLSETPFYTKNVSLSQNGKEINTIEIDPYELKADERLFVYWTITTDANCSYIPTDINTRTQDVPEYVLTNSNLIKVGNGAWASYANQLGSLYVNIDIATDKVIDNGAEIAFMEIPDVVMKGNSGTAFVYVRNLLTTPAKNVELTYTVDGIEKSVSGNLQGAGSAGAVMSGAGYLAIAIEPTVPSLETIADVKVTKVNGMTNSAAAADGFETSSSFDFIATDPDNSFDRVSVVEEATGTWCGYCPAGIVMMETLRKDDPTTVRIGVHYNDRMAIDTYQKFIQEYVPGFPASMVNRYYPVPPTSNNAAKLAMDITDNAAKNRSPFKIELTAVENQEDVKIDLTASVTPAFDYDNSDNRYQVSFVFVEDGVGPYNQTNNYAFGVLGAMGGWEDKGKSVSTIYDDVARRLIGYPGIEGSLEGELKAGQTTAYTTTTTARGFRSDAIRAIAMVIDTKTGYILNAVQIPFVPAGIENMAAETVNDAPVEYFNIQGMRVSNPVAGQIYIKRQGKEVSKIIF